MTPGGRNDYILVIEPGREVAAGGWHHVELLQRRARRD